MRALTVRQPWASHIASGEKWLEIRSRATAYRGALLIHAGLHDRHATDGLPRGAIIARVELVDCVRCEDVPEWERAAQADVAPFAPGHFAWRLANVERLPVHVMARGALGLWTVPASAARVSSRLMA